MLCLWIYWMVTLVMEMFAVVLVDARCWYGGGRRPIVGEWRDNTD